uniref:Structural maintenance of chromosomes protein 1 isoform X2 n=1 Tax=Rhizophora mucronata TaxID=61149 RepID=A0A2P2LWV2_RHIMU
MLYLQAEYLRATASRDHQLHLQDARYLVRSNVRVLEQLLSESL